MEQRGHEEGPSPPSRFPFDLGGLAHAEEGHGRPDVRSGECVTCVNPDIEIENRSHFHDAKKYPLAVLSSMRRAAGRVIFGSVGGNYFRRENQPISSSRARRSTSSKVALCSESMSSTAISSRLGPNTGTTISEAERPSQVM